MIKHIGMFAAALALVVLGYFASVAVQSFSSKPPGPGAPGGYGAGKPTSRPAGDGLTSVEVAPALVAAIRERISGSGFLRPVRQVQIVARTEGEIERIDHEAGAEVAEGAELCHIDERALSIAAATARLERDQAQGEYSRFKELQEFGNASDKEEKDAAFAFEVADTRFRQSELELSYAKPTSPFPGVIVKRSVELGQHVRPGDELFVIADFEPLRMTLFFPESDVLRIKVGQRVELRRDRLTEVISLGRVERVSPIVDESSLTVEVVIDFPDAPASVRPGSFGVVDIITRTLQNACLVPKTALRRDDNGEYVMRVRDNVGQRVSVTTGYRDDSVVQLHEGISAGDLVVVQGGRDLRDGAGVSVHREVPVRLDPLTVVPDTKRQSAGN